MDEVTHTAWWVRRLGAAAGVIVLALIAGGLAARGTAAPDPTGPSPIAESRADEPAQRYGPDPDRRLSPQIHRIIRLAQRSKLDEDKSGGATQFKSPPIQKKTAPPARKQAPVIKKAPAPKKTAPTTRQKAPVIKKKAPVIKKQAPAPKKTVPAPREKAPVIKKKAPVIKKESPPPLKKDAPAKAPQPTEKAPPVTPGGTPEQQKENEALCIQNPNDPSCSKEPAPTEKAPQPTEKAPPAEKDPPVGEKEPQPGPGRPDEDAGGVGSICEQNPQLPQCQLERPDETPPPPGPDGTDTPPFFPPPGAPPVPPGSPPPVPPPPPGDDSGTTPPAPSGPTIQSVSECPPGQRLSISGECFTPCPEGQSWYAGPGNEENTCVDECPGGDWGYVDDGTGQCRQCASGTIENGECECDDGYAQTGDPNAWSLCVWCSAPNTVVDGMCQPACPGGECECPQGYVSSWGQCVLACAETETRVDGSCMPNCADGQVVFAGRCVDSCPDGSEASGGICPNCPAGSRPWLDQCLAPPECPDREVELQEQCVSYCPPGWVNRVNTCVEEQACLDEGGEITLGHCIAPCPDGRLRSGLDNCLGECVEGQVEWPGRCISQGDCPEGQLELEGEGCIPRNECLDDPYMVEREGACLGAGPCAEQGGVVTNTGQCLAQCPEGTTQVGSSCSLQCPEGQLEMGTECVASCPDGQVQYGNECRSGCPSDFEDENGQCTPPWSCGEGQSYFDGQCRNDEDISYDDIVEQCLDAVDSGAFLTSEDPNASPQEQCDGFINDVCQQPGASTYGFCTERPCAQEEADGVGQCPSACPPGQILAPDGNCDPAPSEGEPSAEGNTEDSDDEETSPPAEGTPPAEEGPSEDEEAPTDTETPPQDQGPECEPGTAAYQDVCVTDEQIEEICSGRVLHDGGCEDACPEGTARVGNQCGPAGQAPPPAEEEAPAEEEPVEEQPPADEYATPAPDEEQQPPPGEEQPPAEEEPADELEPCPDGQVRLGDACEVPAEIPRDDFIEACEAGGFPLPPDLAGSSPEEVCDALVESICDGAPGSSNFPPDSRVCTDEAPPPADEQQPPPEETPPAETPPPTDTAPPTDGAPPSTPPAPGGTAPPAGESAPPAPPKKPPAATETGIEAGKATAGLPLAVVIAIDNYDDKGLKGSPQAISNAAHVVRFLKDDLGLDGTRILTGRNATRSDFEDIFGKAGDTRGELRDVIEDTRAQEVIVYFAGQALALNGGKDVVLLPADAEAAKPATGVRLSSLYNALARMGVSKLRLYLDTPFSGGDGVVDVNIQPKIGPAGLFTPQNWVTLSAAGDTSHADETERPRSLFTESLVAGLRGIADTTGEGDGDGTVSMKELHDFTRSQAEAAAKRGGKVPLPSVYGQPAEPLRTY